MIERKAGEITTFDTRAEAHEKVDKQKRYKQILEVLGDKELTAKEIAVDMWQRGMIPTAERNFTAPRLTELSYKGLVEHVGKKRCSWTGKTVTVFRKRSA